MQPDPVFQVGDVVCCHWFADDRPRPRNPPRFRVRRVASSEVYEMEYVSHGDDDPKGKIPLGTRRMLVVQSYWYKVEPNDDPNGL